jgi:hypothetical protein
MKQVNIISTVILAVAVLVAAYAIGLLVRQSRMDAPGPKPVAAEPNDANAPDAVAASRRIGQRPEQATPEEKAQAKEERAKKVADANGLTEEERLEQRDALRERLRTGRGGGPGQIPRLSPEELAKVKNMSEEERRAFRAKLRPRREVGPAPAGAMADPNGGAGTADANATEPN